MNTDTFHDFLKHKKWALHKSFGKIMFFVEKNVWLEQTIWKIVEEPLKSELKPDKINK